MAEDVISKIKDRVDIVDLISSYLKLQKSGINYKARCPFHNEKTGSFFVSPERQIWHCFGCSLGGDIFGFVKQIEGVEFGDALRMLAKRAGVELQPYSPDFQKFQTEKTQLYEITELAVKFYEKQLHYSAGGQEALKYLLDRGLTEQSIKDFRLGWAPGIWDSLTRFLGERYSPSSLVSTGLAIKKDGGGYYDRFRSRIMFPILDLSGQAVGFSGRIFSLKTEGGSTAEKAPEDVAKYVNTPQTLIYDKSGILYGLDKAKLAIRQNNRCLVVEGNVDVIMSHQSGVANTVASSGTALTDGHLKIIKRYTDNLDLCFDADEAGLTATDRGVSLALTRGFNVGVIKIDDEKIKDPADYVQKYGSAWIETAAKSTPFLEMFLNYARKKFDVTTATGKKMFTQRLMPFIASLASKVEQAHWVGEMSLILKLKEEILYQELANTKPVVALEIADAEGVQKQEPVISRLGVVEESLISLALRQPELAAAITPEKSIFLSEICRGLLDKIASAKSEDEATVLNQLIAITDPALKMSLEIAYLKAQELWSDFTDIEMAREFDNLLNQSKKQYVSTQLVRLEQDIRQAEREQNQTQLANLIAEFSKISKELGN